VKLRGSSLSVRTRGLLLMPAGALAVHQLRYVLAYGSHAEGQLAAQGHGYLVSLAPWIVLLLCVGVGSFVARVAQAFATGRDDRRHRPLLVLWALSSAGLLAIYAVQELLEGLFAEGHPGGLAGLFGQGGWWAVLLALIVGAAIVAVLRAAGAIVTVAARLRRTRRAARASSRAPRPHGVELPRIAPLAGAAAGRAPPA
jgi:hypothetical protein